MATKILSVDDSRTIRLIVGNAFRPYDCTILEAANGEEDLAVAGRENVLQIARLGVRDYLVKPFKEDQLIEKAGRCVTLEKRPVATPA
jgi:two-component system cell cycle response regulator